MGVWLLMTKTVRRHWRALALLLLISSCIGLRYAFAEFEGEASPSDATGLSSARLEFGSVGSDVPLCQALIEVARKRLAGGRLQCTPPVPAGDERFGPVDWEILKPSDHIDILKQIFVWSIVNGNWVPDSQKLGIALEKGPALNEELVQDIWDKYKRNYPDLIESGRIRLERATVDLVPKAASIVVYRTNVISAPNQTGSSDWLAEDCYEASGQAPLPQWDLFYEFRPGRWEEFANLNNWASGRSDLILWAGRAYQIDLRNPAGFVVPRHISRSGSLFAAGTDLCVARTVWN